MSVKIIALALIGAAGFGTIAVPTWHALPHTTRVPLEEYDEVARQIFAQLQRRSTSQVAPAVEVPYLADVPLTAEVHYESPPEAWKVDEPLIYSDESRRHVAAYIRYLVVRD
jgi:hypothetical protein